jgi:hypothetical protein
MMTVAVVEVVLVLVLVMMMMIVVEVTPSAFLPLLRVPLISSCRAPPLPRTACSHTRTFGVYG